MLLLAAFLLVLFACSSTDKRGAETKEQLIKIYLRALENKNESVILQLTPPTHIAVQAVHAKVERLGGHHLHTVKTDFISNFGPHMARVTIQAMYKDAKNRPVEFIDEVYVQQSKGRWYLVLGSHQKGTPKLTTLP